MWKGAFLFAVSGGVGGTCSREISPSLAQSPMGRHLWVTHTWTCERKGENLEWNQGVLPLESESWWLSQEGWAFFSASSFNLGQGLGLQAQWELSARLFKNQSDTLFEQCGFDRHVVIRSWTAPLSLCTFCLKACYYCDLYSWDHKQWV